MDDQQSHKPPGGFKRVGAVLHFLRKDQRIFIGIIAFAFAFSILGFLLLTMPSPSLFSRFLSEGVGLAVMVTGMLLILGAASYFVITRFILPSEHFVSYLVAKSRGEQFSKIHKLPDSWKPWTHALSLIFQKTEELGLEVDEKKP